MSLNKCRKCGRELKDQTAVYGWRCAKKLGYSEGFTNANGHLWDTSGYRYAYEKANSFLKDHGYDVDDVDLDMFYMAMVEIIIAELNGDDRGWEKVFWDIVSALYPSYNVKGERIHNAASSMELGILLDIIQWIEDLNLNYPMSRFLSDSFSDYPYLRTDGLPRYAERSINPVIVEEYLMKRNEHASYQFWVDGLDHYDGKSRMEAWTAPIHPDDMSGSKISFNFGNERGSEENGTRSHAAIDIHTREGAPVYAVTEGIVIDHRYFYSGVYQTTVLNFDGSIIRYGEIANEEVPIGTIIRQGDIIGHTTEMYGGDIMLHIEVYSNEMGLNDAFHRDLSNTSNRSNFVNVSPRPYERRFDLINPTMFGALRVYEGKSRDLTLLAK